MAPLDLGPAARAMTALVGAVEDHQLAHPTPCEATSLAAMLDHVDGLALAFAVAARKEQLPPGVDPTPQASADSLTDDWRTRIPARLTDLVAAWREPEAWEGMTSVGGVEMPAEACGATGLDELVVHGWDVARAVHLPYEIDDASVAGARLFVDVVTGPGVQPPPGLFGPMVPVAADASPLDQLVARTGRDPAWSPLG
jgi:uncharacterized protein (TIGR03086 family)